MSTAVAPLARQLAERARQDSGFAEVLDAILEAPTVPHGTLQRIAARSLNDERRGALVREFVEGSLPEHAPEAEQPVPQETPSAAPRMPFKKEPRPTRWELPAQEARSERDRPISC